MMLLFKPELKGKMKLGIKTATRRDWKTQRVKVGSVQRAKTAMLKPEYFAELRILKVFQQRLGDMTEEDALKEGGYTLKEFKNLWETINGEGSWDDNKVVYAIEFEIIRWNDE